jgi:hypothetical protein
MYLINVHCTVSRLFRLAIHLKDEAKKLVEIYYGILIVRCVII